MRLTSRPSELRRALVHLADEAGVKPQIRKVRSVVGRATTRRAIRDDVNLRLLLAFALRPNSCCVDIGCSKGEILREMVRVAPDGRHIAYEPLPEQADRLRRMFPTVEVRQAAVADVEGEAEFTYVVGRPEYSGLEVGKYPGRSRTERITVRTETLDRALPEGYVPDLIKIDVEGAELKVLQGAVGTITQHRPMIVLEHGGGSGDLFGLLAGAGLRVFDFDGDGPYTVQQFAASDHWNFVAHP